MRPLVGAEHEFFDTSIICYHDYMQETLCFSVNNIEILYDPALSHVATHFEDTPTLKRVVIEVLESTNVNEDTMFFEHNLGRIIGTSDLVDTNEDDVILYAKRKNRDTYTRFTTSQTAKECSTITVLIERKNDTQYNLWSAWIGYKGPSFPGDENETPDSKPYWNSHALVWGRQEIDENTITSECPW